MQRSSKWRGMGILIMAGLIGAGGAYALSSKAPVAPSPSPSAQGSQGEQTSQASGSTVWVKRSDGSQQCEPGTEQSLEKAEGELKKAGVTVLDSRKGDDGKMRAQMCGLPTGKENTYLIQKSDLPKAIALGFVEAIP